MFAVLVGANMAGGVKRGRKKARLNGLRGAWCCGSRELEKKICSSSESMRDGL